MRDRVQQREWGLSWFQKSGGKVAKFEYQLRAADDMTAEPKKEREVQNASVRNPTV